jgi:class 3 adenylate cyclase
MRCPKCARDNPDDAKFCVGCGNPIGGRCAKCGAENPADASFCKQCGTRLGGVATQSAATARSERTSVSAEQADSAALDGERKTVTTLFADIKGSMELTEDLDPEEARAIVDPALKLMMDAVQRYGGYVAQSTGDGIFALFGAPVAHEDHPQRALYAAVRMQEELKHYSDRIRAEGRLPIQARVGVNTGEVVVRSIATGEGRSEYVPVGHSTGIAARMQALAPVGSIAATDQIRKLCEGYFLFKSLGPTKVKGVSEPVNVYEVTGPGPLRTRLQRAAARGYTKFVGREREIDALRGAADQARAGHWQIVAAVAETGAGRRVLFFEFKAKNQSEWVVLKSYSVSHGKAAARWDSPDSFFFFQTYAARPRYTVRIWILLSKNRGLGYRARRSCAVRDSTGLVFFAGRKVPMFLFHRRDLKRDGLRPTMPYGYGGFKANLTPFFFSSAILWAEAGGVFASADSRGGCEFRLKSHEAGLACEQAKCLRRFHRRC